MADYNSPGPPPVAALKFERPQGWRFAFAGVNLRDVPDALPWNKYASAKNIRATPTQAIVTRPGYTLLFSTSASPVTDLRAYTVLGTDDLPRFLARNSANQIYLDTGALVATLTGAAGSGVSMVPFRPGESPQAWMYIAGLEDYQKLSAPPVTTAKVGIAEPQVTLDATPQNLNSYVFTGTAANWTPGGTVAGGPADSARITDTAGTVIADPLISSRQSVGVSSTERYDIGMLVSFNGADPVIVQDVLPPVAPLVIQAIRYNSGSTGRCTIVPSQSSVGQMQQVLGAIRRGALVRLGGSETVLVLNRTSGPDGSVCFETVTSGTFAPGATVAGVTAIVVDGPTVSTGNSITSPMISITVGTGIGTLSESLATSPFSQPLGTGLPQEDEYLHISLLVDDPTLLNEIKLIFNVAPGPLSYNNEVYYVAVQPSQLSGIPKNTQTVLQAALNEQIQAAAPPGTVFPPETSAGFSQWSEIMIPISTLTRIGGDQNRTLANCNGMQLLVSCTAQVVIRFGSLWVGGGGQPDIGEDGADYQYRVRPRSSLTGVKGNASPPMRYGVRPRRQKVTVTLPSAAYDSQIDTWDIYRYGGSVTSYRYIGSAAITESTFEDNYFDDAARGGDELEVDNFEPWPSVDVPYKVTGASIAVAGTWIVLSGPTSWPALITRWLPGTLIQLGGQSAYTLRSRPTALSATSYLFEVEECIGPSILPDYFWVLEPKVARQILPYLWGPDAAGTFFGVGDTLRPGSVYFSKSNQPDATSDRYNLELSPPSEPLIGGGLVRGVSLVASTQRWWALYPAFGTATRYNPIEQTVGKGLLTPYGHCSDGERIFFWGRDGIYATNGQPAQSLTDPDLYNIFPHEGVLGVNVLRNTVTYYAPDYGRAATFRLSRVNTYLYADYQDTSGIARTIVCDLRTGGWSQDIYANAMDVHYGTEQQEGPLLTSGSAYPLGIMADTSGKVYTQVDCVNDNGTPIPCLVATFEWDGGDQRAQPLFGDSYLDCVPVSGLTVTPVSLGTGVATPTIIAPSSSRQFVPISVNGGELQKFMGQQIEWTE